MNNPVKKYEDFHGKPARNKKMQEFYVPESLVYLGEAIAVEYRCSKLNGGGDGKRAVYRHKFETPAMLCMDERAKKQLFILGPSIAVNSRGIIR
jgi:hypothetical protein